MSLEEYIKKVEEHLLKSTNSVKFTNQLMKDYQNDFQQFYDEGFDPIVLAGAMINYFV